MWHLILILPVIGLAVFWLWPLSIALPLYLLILAVSGFVAYLLVRAMRRPVVTGAEGIIGRSGEVVDTSGRQTLVHVAGQDWEAVSADTLRKGDKAKVVAVDGLTLTVTKDISRRLSNPTKHPAP